MTDHGIPFRETEALGRRAAAGKALLVFILIMAALSVANRALNEISTPVVAEAKVQRGALEKRIDADGQVRAAVEAPVFAPVQARVAAVHVRSGQQVGKGDPLFTLDMDALSDLLDQTQNELAKLKNDREKAAGSMDGAPDSAPVGEAEAALKRAEAALQGEQSAKEKSVGQKKAEADHAQTRFAQAEAAYETALEDARRDYLKEAARQREEKNNALIEKQKAFDWAAADVSKWTMDQYREYVEDAEKARVSYNEAARRLEAAQASLAEAEGTHGEAAVVAAIKKARSKAKEEKKDLDAAIRRRDGLTGIREYLKAQRELNIARSDFSAADAAYQSAAANTPETLREIERKVSGEKSDMASAEKELAEKTSALDDAMRDRDKALEDAAKDVDSAKTALRKARDAWRGQALDAANNDSVIIEKEAELARIEAAISAKGVVSAPSSGQIARCDVEPGKGASPDEAALTIGRTGEGLEVCIPVTEEEAGYVTVGNTAEISLGDARYECPIFSIAPSADEKGKFNLRFRLPGSAGQPGMTASATIQKRTKNYEAVIPLSALRKDDMGYYVYTLVKSEGALGVETRVKRVNVQVLDKDATRAAVSGGVTGRDRLAARSDRALREGDRVNVE